MVQLAPRQRLWTPRPRRIVLTASPGARWPEIDDQLRRLGVPFGAPTFGGTEKNRTYASCHNSPYHGARDYGSAANDMWRIYNALLPYAQGGGYVLSELFFDPGGWWSNGRPDGRRGGHGDHVHACIGAGRSFVVVPPPPPPPPPTYGDDVELVA